MKSQLIEQWKRTPLNGQPFLSVVVPCYNEEERILPTLGAIASVVSSYGITWELVVVDDGSTDRTAQQVTSLALENLNLVCFEKNQGKGAAVRAGVEAARGAWILFTDADNSTPIQELWKFIPAMITGERDVLCGSRALATSQVAERSYLRRTATRTLSGLLRLGLGLPVRDSQCGFKAFKRQVALDLLSRQHLTGFAFDMELLYLAKHLGYKTEEIGVRWVDAPGSKVSTVRETMKFLKAIVSVRQEHSHLTTRPILQGAA